MGSLKNRFLSLIQLRQIEKEALGKNLNLIDEAGSSIALWVKHNLPKPKNILVLVGKGNNGADGVNAALKLKQAGYNVSVFKVLGQVNSVTSELIIKFKQQQGKVLIRTPNKFDSYDLIIDAILGIGIHGELDDKLIDIINLVNNSKKCILAIDTPSGLNPFSGGMAKAVINAWHTITFISDKPGFYTGSALDVIGEVIVSPLVNLIEYKLSNQNYPVITNGLATVNYRLLLRNKHNTNKGNFGFVAILGGSKGMHGAAYLAARAAILMGSGKVIIGSLDSSFTNDYAYPEIMVTSAKDILKNLDNYTVVVVGPGLGCNLKAVKFLTKLLDQEPKGKLIFDADALNILALYPELQYKFKHLPHKIITPHPGEAARLLDTNVVSIQSNRFEAIKKLVERYSALTLLKGAGSLISKENGNIYLNQTGNPTLSSAGQGDSLCGVIAALIAQGLELSDALRLAVYLHGLAADDLVATRHGQIGILASEVTLNCRRLINQFLYQQ